MEEARELLCGYVLEDDIIPRLSLSSIHLLHKELNGYAWLRGTRDEVRAELIFKSSQHYSSKEIRKEHIVSHLLEQRVGGAAEASPTTGASSSTSSQELSLAHLAADEGMPPSCTNTPSTAATSSTARSPSRPPSPVPLVGECILAANSLAEVEVDDGSLLMTRMMLATFASELGTQFLNPSDVMHTEDKLDVAGMQQEVMHQPSKGATVMGPVVSSLSSTAQRSDLPTREEMEQGERSYAKDPLTNVVEERWLTIQPALLRLNETDLATSSPQHPKRSDCPYGRKDLEDEGRAAGSLSDDQWSRYKPTTCQVDSGGNVGRRYSPGGGMQSRPLKLPQTTNGHTPEAAHMDWLVMAYVAMGEGAERDQLQPELREWLQEVEEEREAAHSAAQNDFEYEYLRMWQMVGRHELETHPVRSGTREGAEGPSSSASQPHREEEANGAELWRQEEQLVRRGEELAEAEDITSEHDMKKWAQLWFLSSNWSNCAETALFADEKFHSPAKLTEAEKDSLSSFSSDAALVAGVICSPNIEGLGSSPAPSCIFPEGHHEVNQLGDHYRVPAPPRPWRGTHQSTTPQQEEDKDRQHVPLYPPGQLYHLLSNGVQEESKGGRTLVRAAAPEDFTELPLTLSSVTNHNPLEYMVWLRRALKYCPEHMAEEEKERRHQEARQRHHTAPLVMSELLFAERIQWSSLIRLI
uniref:Uncharacterized protein n=1 Tax=Pyramimonas obovata TaxID=1411642 RepID=A0A7S0RQ87_9CHLO|mmetsp:Transcript_39591/g.86250  ORF Transcript_39591/g.86250 Transcript_39591/m.86250 type:complete len:696 (+) Transcript_39591:660-2747(+)